MAVATAPSLGPARTLTSGASRAVMYPMLEMLVSTIAA